MHLVVLPERHYNVRTEQKTIKLVAQTNARRAKIAEWMLSCRLCDAHIGNECKVGPKKEPVFCFNSVLTYLQRPGSRERIAGIWSRLSAQELGVLTRDYSTFYGEGMVGRPDGRIVPMMPVIRARSECLCPSDRMSGGLRLADLTRDKPRPYQIECFVQAVQANTIVYLPTGGGKTLVSVLVARLMKRLNPGKQVLFIVDRIPLVFQQGQYFREQAPDWDVLMACGETADSEDDFEKPLQAYDVISCTAQTLINWLQVRKLWLEDCCCLIIDEVHHAVKSHPFVTILDRHYRAIKEENFRPLFLGLTASPAGTGGVVSMQLNLDQLCLLCSARLYTPLLYQQELLQAINRPAISFTTVDPLPDALALESLVSAFCQSTLVARLFELLHVEKNGNGAEILTRFFLRKLLEAAHDSKSVIAQRISHYLHQFYSSLEMISILGTQYAKKYLLELVAQMISKHEADLWRPTELVSIERFIQRLNSGPFESTSPKVEALLALLTDASSAGSDDRSIIFVQTKKTARWLCSLLNEHRGIETSLHPKHFVGQAAGQLDGMSWHDKQKHILRAFHLGETRLLVATSVLQEGLDVPVCNRIILFDQTWSLTSFVQSRGRARHRESQYIVLCSEAECRQYKEIVSMERTLHDVIMNRFRQASTSRSADFIGGLKVPVNFGIMRAIFELVSQAEGAKNWQNASDPSTRIELGELAPNLDSQDASQLVPLELVLYTNSDALEVEDVFLQEPRRVVLKLSHQAHFSHALHIDGKVPKMLVNSGKGLVEMAGMIGKLLTVCPSTMAHVALKLVGNRHESVHFLASDFAFGSLLTENSFLPVPPVISGQPIKLCIEPLRKVIRIFFSDATEVFRLDVEFASIDQMVMYEQDTKHGRCILHIPLLRSPMLYSTIEGKSEHDVLSSLQLVSASIDTVGWRRCTALGSMDFPLTTQQASGANRDSISLRNVGNFAAIRIGLALQTSQQSLLLQALHRLGGIPLMFASVMEVADGHVMSPVEIDAALLRWSSFDAAYAVRAALDSTFAACTYRITKAFIDHLGQFFSAHHIGLLSLWVEQMQKSRFADPLAIFQMLEQEEMHRGPQSVASNTELIRFLTLTPARLILHLPRPMTCNRVIRKFGGQHFLRLHVRDEDNTKLSSIRCAASLERLLTRLQVLLDKGITIAGHRFDFLAMSSSQLREHGCWFVEEHWEGGQVVDASTIRSWMGDFSSIKNVAKYVARLGQSLSASQSTVHVEPPRTAVFGDNAIVYEEIADIEHNTCNYSDGIGMISPALARRVAQCLDRRPSSAYQIRFGGFKGVVAVNPSVPMDAPVYKLWLRPSQRKFRSSHLHLEVLNCSEHIPCFLNRQVLMIMSGLGVDDAAFKKLQDEMLADLAEMLIDSCVARRMLSSHYGAFPRLVFDQADALQYAYEPFFRSLLLAIYRKKLSDLLTKSRVFVPRGRILMGVIDELGILGPDEVFVQCSLVATDIDDELVRPSSLGLTVTAPVAVAKNPCMHPGDLRVLRAVPNERLAAYYVDVLVFPQTSLRPITDMCSGSDLDGDLYFVTWHPSLIPPQQHEPMDYASGLQPVELDRPVAISDIARFMVDFIANDQLGSIANAHVAHVDQRPLGVCDPLCMQLAKIFSLAVDFPKTGFVASLPVEARVSAYPDFMQKSERPSYVSNKVIGKMFRKTRSICQSHDAKVEVAIDPAYIVNGHEAFLDEARSLYARYVQQVARILCIYGVREEAHLFSGAIVEYGQLGKEDAKEAMQIVSTLVKHVQRIFRREALQLHSIENPDELITADFSPELAMRASAWYVCSYGNPSKPLGVDAPILSFAWILGDVLVGIRKRNAPSPLADVHHVSASPPPLYRNIGSEACADMLRMIDDEDLPTCFVERHQFARQLQLQLVGSSQWMLFDSFSDVNLVSSPTDDLAVLFRTLKADYQNLKFANGTIRNEGLPFTFTINANFNLISQTKAVCAAFLEEPELLVAASAVTRWAKAASLLRRTADHVGLIPQWQLLLVLIRMLSEHQQMTSPYCANDSPSKLSADWLAIFKHIESFGEEHKASVGYRLLTFFRALAFSDQQALAERLSSSYGVDLHPDKVLLLTEHAFRAFHTLAQTTSLGATIAASSTSMTEIEQDTRAGRRRPTAHLLRRYGASNSFFMEGSSLLLFYGCNSPKELVTFDLYSHRRRPHHYDKQCYQPVLRQQHDSVDDDSCSALFADYYAHTTRQFALARRLGSERFGSLKVQVKFGHVYVTHLPRLFIEEVGSSTVELVHQALAKGYTMVQKGDLFHGEEDNDEKDLTRLEVGRVIEGESKPTVVAKEADFNTEPNKRLVSVIVKPRKKPTLTAMTSSFEPSVPSTHSIIQKLESLGYTSVDRLSGYVVCTVVYDCDVDRNREMQLVYNDQLVLQRASYRPLRWLLEDIRFPGEDLRISLSSTRRLELLGNGATSDRSGSPAGKGEARNELEQVIDEAEGSAPSEASAAVIREGILELTSDGAPRVREPFRGKDQQLFVRRSATERFVIRGGDCSLLYSKDLAIRHALSSSGSSLDATLLSRFSMLVLHVTEYSDADPHTGLFGIVVEKCEFEVQLLNMDWNADLLKDQQRDELVRAVWAMAQVGRVIVQGAFTSS